MEITQQEKNVIQSIAFEKDSADREIMTQLSQHKLSDPEANEQLAESNKKFAQALQQKFVSLNVPQEAVDIVFEYVEFTNCEYGSEAIAWDYCLLAKALNITADTKRQNDTQ